MLTIRPERPGDEPGIHAVHVACFPGPAEAELVDALRAAGRLTFSFVAEAGGQVVGHVAFSPVSATGAANGVGLAPVAVVESHRKRGIAAALIRTGLDACRNAGWTWAVVLGSPAYYNRFGFGAATGFGLSDEYGGGPAFQALALSPGGMPTGAGLVRYAPEFAAFA
jgi:putative acetyltransferase